MKAGARNFFQTHIKKKIACRGAFFQTQIKYYNTLVAISIRN